MIHDCRRRDGATSQPEAIHRLLGPGRAGSAARQVGEDGACRPRNQRRAAGGRPRATELLVAVSGAADETLTTDARRVPVEESARYPRLLTTDIAIDPRTSGLFFDLRGVKERSAVRGWNLERLTGQRRRHRPARRADDIRQMLVHSTGTSTGRASDSDAAAGGCRRPALHG